MALFTHYLKLVDSTMHQRREIPKKIYLQVVTNVKKYPNTEDESLLMEVEVNLIIQLIN